MFINTGLSAEATFGVRATNSELIKLSLFYQGVMIIPEFRKPEQLAGISLHFPSYFIRIQTLFDRTNPGLAHIKPEANQTSFHPEMVFQVSRPGGTNLDAPRGVDFLHASAQFVDFPARACSGPDPGTRSPLQKPC
jgi:hypothetical protein